MVPALYRRNAFILIFAACQAVQVARSVCVWSREGEKNHDRLSNCSCSGSKFGSVIINPTKCLLLAPRKMPVIKLLKLFTERLLELSFCPWLREQKQAMEKTNKKTTNQQKTTPNMCCTVCTWWSGAPWMCWSCCGVEFLMRMLLQIWLLQPVRWTEICTKWGAKSWIGRDGDKINPVPGCG